MSNWGSQKVRDYSRGAYGMFDDVVAHYAQECMDINWVKMTGRYYCPRAEKQFNVLSSSQGWGAKFKSQLKLIEIRLGMNVFGLEWIYLPILIILELNILPLLYMLLLILKVQIYQKEVKN